VSIVDVNQRAWFYATSQLKLNSALFLVLNNGSLSFGGVGTLRPRPCLQGEVKACLSLFCRTSIQHLISRGADGSPPCDLQAVGELVSFFLLI
jgi:hypothetical protein